MIQIIIKVKARIFLIITYKVAKKYFSLAFNYVKQHFSSVTAPFSSHVSESSVWIWCHVKVLIWWNRIPCPSWSYTMW